MGQTDRLNYVRALLDQGENWEVDHNAAMNCYRVEERAALFVYVFGRLNKCDREYQHAQLVNGLPWDEGFERLLRDVFREWLEHSKGCLDAIVQCEQGGFTVEGSDKFRLCRREAEGMLTLDDEFFTGAKFAELEDAAVESYRKGEVDPM